MEPGLSTLSFGYGMNSEVSALVVRPSSAYYYPKIVSLKVSTYEATYLERLLAEISRLPDGWDGYDAPKIDDEAVQNARTALGVLTEEGTPAPEISPDSNGTISFEWASQKGFAHLEIGNHLYSFYVRSSGGFEPFEGEVAQWDLSVIRAYVRARLFPSAGPSLSLTRLPS